MTKELEEYTLEELQEHIKVRKQNKQSEAQKQIKELTEQAKELLRDAEKLAVAADVSFSVTFDEDSEMGGDYSVYNKTGEWTRWESSSAYC